MSIYNLSVQQTNNYLAIGLSCPVRIGNFQFDISSNMAHGRGIKFQYTSSQTHKSDKVNVHAMNIGYNVKVWSLDNAKYSVTPYIGIGFLNDIYEDPIPPNSYYIVNKTSKLSAGINLVAQYKTVGVYIKGVEYLRLLNLV
jgi:hypothetical protein